MQYDAMTPFHYHQNVSSWPAFQKRACNVVLRGRVLANDDNIGRRQVLGYHSPLPFWFGDQLHIGLSRYDPLENVQQNLWYVANEDSDDHVEDTIIASMKKG